MPRTFYVVGEEITLDGECIGQIYTSLPAVLFQDICDTLEGIELYDQHNDGTLQQLEAIKDKEGVQANKRKGFLSIARKWLYRHRRDKWVLEQTLSAVNQHLTVALQERDQARQWAEGVALQLQETLRERDEARAFAESLLART